MAKAAGDIIYAGKIPGEVIELAERDTTPSTFTAETVIDTVTADLIDGCTYLVAHLCRIASSVADGRVLVNLREDSISGTIVGSGRVHTVGMVAANSEVHYLEVRYTAAATGSKTFVATAQRESGTGNITAGAASVAKASLSVAYESG